ncbi:MAG TPA: long-chain-fatty-acid--CoA ligase [Symbiobacteriaceae bacterium]
MYDISYWIRSQAWMRPESVAVVGSEVRWTYRELDDLVSRLANGLRTQLGVRQGDRVAIYSVNGPEYLLVLLAAARSGTVLVPLNWRLSLPELEFQVRDSGVRRILCSSEYVANAQELTGRIGLEPPVRITRGEPASGLLELEQLLAAGPGDMAGAEPLSWDLPLLIGYTSGTTGKPKGAVLTSANFFWNAMNDLLTIDLRSADVTITLLPMFHIGGLGLFTMPTLLAGGKVVIPNKFDPVQAVELIQREGVTIVFGVPAVNLRLLEAIDQMKPDLSRVRMFYSGGAPCPVDLIRAFHDRGYAFGQGYGLTETAPTVFMMVDPADYLRKAGSIGRPAAFSRVRLQHPTTGQLVDTGEVGEIVVKGPNVFSQYWQNDEATRKAVQDGWFHTGDLARADEEGFVTIAGRLKEMIISGGENVYPVEVEQAIMSHPDVIEAAVYGVPHPQWGEVPHAALLLAPGSTLTEEALRAYCTTRLAKYKIPKRFHFMTELPRNAAGKVLKGELVRMLVNA